ncbi:MAG: YcaO-like family protein [Dolichospermum sp.]
MPQIQPAELAVCSGKGLTPAQAAIRMIGESVERLSAWSRASQFEVGAAIGILPLPDDQWHVERVPSSPSESGAGVAVVNLLDTADVRLAPRELVLLGPFDAHRRFRSDTTGLAAHTLRHAAHRAALYECIESALQNTVSPCFN